jgi:YesN/AraC family two-component response regulator
VTAFTNSVEAIEAFKAAPDAFDVVITDQTLPRMTGDQLAAEMLEIRPDLPIILCTGYSDTCSRDEAMTMGVREYLMKPILRDDFARAIRKVLGVAHQKGG